MPIDPDAYMAGAIPTLSRGGSWLYPETPISPVQAYASSRPVTATQPPTPSYGVQTGQQAMTGFSQNPLLLGRMAAFGSPSAMVTNPASPHTSSNTAYPAAASRAGLSPTRLVSRAGSLKQAQQPENRGPLSCAGWADQEVSRQRISQGGSRAWRSAPVSPFDMGGCKPLSWPIQENEPQLVSKEAAYPASHHHQRNCDRPQTSQTFRSRLSDQAVIAYARRSDPTVSRSGTQAAANISVHERDPAHNRPTLPRQLTYQPQEASLPLPPAHSRSRFAPSAPCSPVHTSSYNSMKNLQGAPPMLPSGRSERSRGYISPLSTEAYNRYSLHPSADVPYLTASADLTSPPPATSCLRTPEGAVHYLPLGYAQSPRDMKPNRDGPALKTYGVPWTASDAEGARLTAAPDGPRWLQAAPPNVVHPSHWWASS